MPALRDRIQRACAEFKESCEMVLEIEKEGLRLARFEIERGYCLIMQRFRRMRD